MANDAALNIVITKYGRNFKGSKTVSFNAVVKYEGGEENPEIPSLGITTCGVERDMAPGRCLAPFSKELF